MAPEGLDEAREAFAQEIPQATRQRDVSGRFVSTGKPEAIFQPREVEGDDRGDTRDGGADPRLLEQERRVADGRSEEGDDVPKPAKRAATPANDNDGAAEDQPPERIGEGADDADPDAEKPDKGDGAEGDPGEDASPRYKIQVDGAEVEVSLNEALRATSARRRSIHRMRQMVEVAKTIDQRGAEAQQARDAYIQLCQNQEQEFSALIPQEPDWDQLYKQDPGAARQLEQNFKAVYGTLNAIRQRRETAQREAYQRARSRPHPMRGPSSTSSAPGTSSPTRPSVDHAIGDMRQTAMNHGFSEDEIGTTYDERMLTVLHKAAKYDHMMAQQTPAGAAGARGRAPAWIGPARRQWRPARDERRR